MDQRNMLLGWLEGEERDHGAFLRVQSLTGTSEEMKVLGSNPRKLQLQISEFRRHASEI
jgi:hypothetical protein